MFPFTLTLEAVRRPMCSRSGADRLSTKQSLGDSEGPFWFH